MSRRFFIPQNMELILSKSPQKEDSDFILSLLHRESLDGCVLKKKCFGKKTVYTINANYNGRAHRLIFESVTLAEGGSGFVLRSIAWNHDYEKALTWLPIEHLDERAFQNRDIEVIEEESRRLVSHYGQWYELSPLQSDVFGGLKFPQLIVGPPGSGKTLLALSYFQERALMHQEQEGVDVLKMLYLTGNPQLKRDLHASWSLWKQTALPEESLVEMSFLTIDELLYSGHPGTRLSQEEALALCSPGKGKKTYYEEFLLNAHVLNQDIGKPYEESLYQHTGMNQSLIHDELEKKEAYELYQRIFEKLKKKNQYVAGMSLVTPEDGAGLYDVVVVDEIQNETMCDLLSALNYSQRDASNTPRIIFLGDSLQKAKKKISSLTLLESSLRHHDIFLHTSSLTCSHRLPAFVNECAEKLVLLCHMLNQGKVDRTAYSLLSERRHLHEDIDKDSVQFLDETRKEELKHLGSNAQAVVIIFREEDREAARMLVPDGLVLTVEEVQGLERKDVCIFLPKEAWTLFSSVNQEMNEQKITKDTPLKVLENLSPKKGVHVNLEHLSRLYIALTRTYGTVWFYTDVKEKALYRNLLLSWIKSHFVSRSTKRIEEGLATPQQWLDTIHELNRNGLISDASRFLCQHLGLSHDEAAAYLKQQKVRSDEQAFKEWLDDFRAQIAKDSCSFVSAPKAHTAPKTSSVVARARVDELRITSAPAPAAASVIPLSEQILLKALNNEPYSEAQLINILSRPIGAKIWDEDQRSFLLKLIKNDVYRRKITGALLNHRDMLDKIPCLNIWLKSMSAQKSECWYQEMTYLMELHKFSRRGTSKTTTLPLLIVVSGNKARDYIAYCYHLGADLNKAGGLGESVDDGITPLIAAVSSGFKNIVTDLIAFRVNVDQAAKTGATPVFMAAQQGYEFILDALIAAKADVNKARVNGETPLLMAIQQGHWSCVEVLIAAKADVNKPMMDGVSPIFMAIQQNDMRVLKALIAAKANLNQTADPNDATPLVFAVSQNFNLLVDVLITAGADVNKPTKDGVTPLFVAVNNGNLTAMKALLAAGADVNIKTTRDETPLSIARQKGDRSIVDALLAAQKKPVAAERYRFHSAIKESLPPPIDAPTP